MKPFSSSSSLQSLFDFSQPTSDSSYDILCFHFYVFFSMFSFLCFHFYVFISMFSFPCFLFYVFFSMFSFLCFHFYIFFSMFSFLCFLFSSIVRRVFVTLPAYVWT